ncbi:hypothetical protein [Chryseobacterium sp.]|uniref:hypothetical protein n=1 Tax=Chryseobacterium sp. TaxID=1871047 RepID=UPI0012A954CD|nr:hypothetical protein [Chryseobacterium sp.]QFG53375.1 hypothetical protein F7R58_07375 [Chryseobacterium sp.]
MKKTAIKTAVLGILLFVGFSEGLQAQHTNSLIEEVRITNKDGFTQLRNIIAQNFDFTDPQLTEGTTNSLVKFNISTDGKIENVRADSRCRAINKNLESALSGLHLRFKGQRERPVTYVMPVEIAIASR